MIACHPAAEVIVRQHSRFMIRIFKSAVKFAIAMIVMAVVCAIVWDEFVAWKLYDCTDSLPFGGYLSPGDWVHSWTGHPVVTVHQVVHGRSMSEPDTIKEGWGIGSLWCLWFAFFGVSLVASILVARIRWIPKQSTEQIYEDSHAA